jgi:hypothetical protein
MTCRMTCLNAITWRGPGRPDGAQRIEDVTLVGNTSIIPAFNAPLRIEATGDTALVVHNVTFNTQPYTGASAALAPPSDMVIDALGGAGEIDVSGNTFIDDAGTFASPDDSKNGKAAVSMIHSDGPVHITNNRFSGYRSAVEVSGRAGSSTFPGISIQGNDIAGTYDSVAPDKQGAALSITTENAGPGPAPFVDVVDNSIHDADVTSHGWDIHIVAGSTTPPVHVDVEGDRVAGGFGGVFWQGSNGSSLHLGNDFVTGTRFGVSVGAGSTGIDLTNVTFRRNNRDISNSGDLSLDSTLVEDPILVSGGASCSITFSRGPVTDPSVPDGCSDFQTALDPVFSASGNLGYRLDPTSPLIDQGSPRLRARPISRAILGPSARGADCRVRETSAPTRSTCAHPTL